MARYVSAKLPPGQVAVQVGRTEKIGTRLNITIPREAVLDRLQWVRVWLDAREGKIRLTPCAEPSRRRGSPGQFLKERKVFHPTGEHNRKVHVPFVAMGKSRNAPLRFGRYIMGYAETRDGDIVIDMPEPLLHYVRKKDTADPEPASAKASTSRYPTLQGLDAYEEELNRGTGPTPADRGREAARHEPRANEDRIEDILQRIAELNDDQVDEVTQVLQKLSLYDKKLRRTILNTMRR